MKKIKDLPILNIDPSPFFILEVPLKYSQKIISASLSPPQAPPDDIPDIINYKFGIMRHARLQQCLPWAVCSRH